MPRRYNHPISAIPKMMVPMVGITEPAIIAIINIANNSQAAILALARRVKGVMTLLIIGILCGFTVNAVVSVLNYHS
jgi:hypothetical protein